MMALRPTLEVASLPVKARGSPRPLHPAPDTEARHHQAAAAEMRSVPRLGIRNSKVENEGPVENVGDGYGDAGSDSPSNVSVHTPARESLDPNAEDVHRHEDYRES